ncbi:MAG: ABC transporter permease [Gammaproteobacteria bacterium]|nr:ABC transporter permease [Gammaproteobacteria bacterium]
MMFKRFFAVFLARNREFWRDRGSLGWNIMLPALTIIGFALAFSDGSVDLYKVGVYENQEARQGLPEPNFLKTDYIQFIPSSNLDKAMTKVERHQLDMLLDLSLRRYWINDSSPHGYILERILWGADDNFSKQTVSGREISYVDWVIPGVLGMNMMFSAMFGVGYVIVRYRKSGVLKRLKATPLSAFEFLAAQVASRLWLIMTITVLIFFGADLFIDFSMFGSYTDLFALFTLGAITLISLGLLTASRISSEELASGLLNLITLPMMFFSEVWFSLEGAHPILQKIAQIFPLTHVLSGARAIMNDGATLADISFELTVLALMTAVFLSLGSYTFRWE